MQRLDRRVERVGRQGGRIELAAREAEVLRGQLPAAAGAHAVAERALAGRPQHGRRQRRAQQLDLVVVARRRGRVQIPRADVAGDGAGVGEGLLDGRGRSGDRRRDDVVGVRADADGDRLHAQDLEAAGGHVVVVAEDPHHGSAGDVRALQARQRQRDAAVGGEDAGAEEAADDQRVRRWIGGADHDRLRFAAADRVHRQLERDAEGGAGGHRREGQAGDLAEHRDLRRRRVVDVPHDVGRHLPGRIRGAPLLLQLAAGRVAGPDDVHLAAVDAAGDAGLLDLGEGGQVLPELGRAVGPVAMPGVDGGLAILGLGVHGRSGGRRRRDAVDRRRCRGCRGGRAGRCCGPVRPRSGPNDAAPCAARCWRRRAGRCCRDRCPRRRGPADRSSCSTASRPGFWRRAWMNAPMAYIDGQSIFSSSWAKRRGGKRSAIHSR